VDISSCAPAANTTTEDMPARPVPDRELVRKVRRMDDPEILQRVLAGLLNLQ